MTYFEEQVLKVLEQHAQILRTQAERITEIQQTISQLCESAHKDTEFFRKISEWAAGCQEGFKGHERILTIIVDALVNHQILKKDAPKQDTIN